MSKTQSTDKNVTTADRVTITQHYEDPQLVENAATYHKCSDCGRETIREGDLRRPEAHAKGCSAR